MNKHIETLSSSFCTQLGLNDPFLWTTKAKIGYESDLVFKPSASFTMFVDHVLPWAPLW